MFKDIFLSNDIEFGAVIPKPKRHNLLICVVTFFLFYRKIPILGKHSRKIVCGAWSLENLLALGSEDKSISISNADGDSLRQTNMRDVPSAIQFSEMKTDERSTMGQNTVRMYDFVLIA